MRIANITFKKTIVDVQIYNSFNRDDDYLVSTIFFTLDVDGNAYDDMEVEVRQPRDSNYMEEPLEVGRIIGEYKGDWNHNDFSDKCEDYYRQCIGPEGRGLNFSSQADVRMRDCSFEVGPVQKPLKIPEIGGNAC